MKRLISSLLAVTFFAFTPGCGKASHESGGQAPDPVTQPEAQAALFERTIVRVKSLIAAKDFKNAETALAAMKNYKLTPEQQKLVDQLQAQIPPAK